ncbi:MAG: hypothetical protein ACTSWY_01235 [Promethearchaeota archaeon]
MRKKIITLIMLLLGVSMLAIGLTINQISAIPGFYLKMVFGS